MRVDYRGVRSCVQSGGRAAAAVHLLPEEIEEVGGGEVGGWGLGVC